jgi:AraC-like DNA-binding protein
MDDQGQNLTDRQRAMLDFERTWWQFDEPRDELIAQRFGCSTKEYYDELNEVLDTPGAMSHDPLVVRRFQRRRIRRRRSLHDAQPHAELRRREGGATHD